MLWRRGNPPREQENQSNQLIQDVNDGSMASLSWQEAGLQIRIDIDLEKTANEYSLTI